LLGELIGIPQLVAVAVLLQRGLEELYSRRNTANLLAKGGREVGRAYYPVVAVSHLAWIAGIFLLLPPASPVIWWLAAVYVALQVVRVWVIASLGPFWTHRIITVAGIATVRRGPYRWIRHPNYAVTVAETFLLPLVFGGWGVALIMTAIWVAVIRYKIVLEDQALAERRELDPATAAE
jgi:methyltransferase